MTTPKQLKETVARLQRKGIDIEIGWAYGRPRCTNKTESRDLSPRLPTGQMAIWLDGFEEGMEAFTNRKPQVEKEQAQCAQ